MELPLPAPLPTPELEALYSAPTLPTATTPLRLAEAMRKISAGEAMRQAADHMISGCAVLR